MIGQSQLTPLETIARPSIADAVFDQLHDQILSLQLPPGTKLSEVDVARSVDVSRQPVRDAFYRLSKLGFLTIRPQRATVVSSISPTAVMQARFVRASLELETVRAACERLGPADIDSLSALIDRQSAAIAANDPLAFHGLDDQFHREICERAGLGFAWEIIRENKAHMDRVRYLSLSFASRDAFEDHVNILTAIKARDPQAATGSMRLHLSRIKTQLLRIRDEFSEYFSGDADSDF